MLFPTPTSQSNAPVHSVSSILIKPNLTLRDDQALGTIRFIRNMHLDKPTRKRMESFPQFQDLVSCAFAYSIPWYLPVLLKHRDYLPGTQQETLPANDLEIKKITYLF